MDALCRAMLHTAVAILADVLLQSPRGTEHRAHLARPACAHIDGHMAPKPRVKIGAHGAAKVGQRIQKRMPTQRHKMRQRAICLHMRRFAKGRSRVNAASSTGGRFGGVRCGLLDRRGAASG